MCFARQLAHQLKVRRSVLHQPTMKLDPNHRHQLIPEKLRTQLEIETPGKMRIAICQRRTK
jgi:hypothetical protein